MRIFVGSSDKYVTRDAQDKIDITATAAMPLPKLVKALRKYKRYQLEPWWEDDILETGKNVLDTLIAKAQTCDGGIFVFGKDDLLHSKGSGTKAVQKAVTRGNVILECGMFLGSKGKHHTFMMKDGHYDAIKLPSDIQGHLLADLSDKGLAAKIDRFFKAARDKTQSVNFMFYINEEHMQEIIDKKYRAWRTKSLYIGSESARTWKQIETGDDYLQSGATLSKFALTNKE
jgi:hypothetical protein